MINDIVRYFGLLAIDMPERRLATVVEHDKIIKALKTKDLDKIRKSMQIHMNNTTQALIRRLQ